MNEHLQAFLVDVRDQGSARVSRGKLAWMLNRQNVNETAFRLIQQEWEQILPNGRKLYVLNLGDEYTFTSDQVILVTSKY